MYICSETVLYGLGAFIFQLCSDRSYHAIWPLGTLGELMIIIVTHGAILL